ncbi:MAG TPA: cytochrome c family protein [Rhizomicrobium sp.]|jgi:cytochrome c|nr:cytochrome c family protein [Rhizomicrobium sp.]
MNSRLQFAGAVALATLLTQSGDAADVSNGKAMFSRCAACHNAVKGGPNMIGPNLHGVVGRKAGTKSGFSYSLAMKNSGITWTNQKLDAYIAHPAQVVPANRMAFAGISDPKQRADLIAYLGTLK